MRMQIVMKLIPGLLATTLVALACEKPPNPAAPKRPSFAALDERTDRITGGGKLGDGRDFATFGFNARFGQGQIEWVQHCLDGVDPGSKNCSSGSFTFHGSSGSEYGPPLPLESPLTTDDPDHCRAWSGSGEAKFKDPSFADGPFFFTAKACDFGHPGRTDFICFALLGTYSREGTLTGGNIQLHEGATESPETNCEAVVRT